MGGLEGKQCQAVGQEITAERLAAPILGAARQLKGASGAEGKGREFEQRAGAEGQGLGSETAGEKTGGGGGEETAQGGQPDGLEDSARSGHAEEHGGIGDLAGGIAGIEVEARTQRAPSLQDPEGLLGAALQGEGRGPRDRGIARRGQVQSAGLFLPNAEGQQALPKHLPITLRSEGGELIKVLGPQRFAQTLTIGSGKGRYGGLPPL